MKADVVLRFLTGPLAPADLKLPEGVYLAGSGDDCDLMLQYAEDFALRLKAEEGGVLSVEAVRGKILVNSQPLQEGSEVTVGDKDLVLLPVGFVAVLQQDGLVSEEAEKALDAALKNGSTDRSSVVPADSSENKDNSEETAEVSGAESVSVPEERNKSNEGSSSAEESSSEEFSSGNASLTGGNTAETEDRGHILGKIILMLSVLLCFLLLCFLLFGSSVFTSYDRMENSLQTARQYAADYGNVSVSERNGAVVYSGTLEGKEEFERFTSALPELSVPAVLEIRQEDSLLSDLEKAFAQRGMIISASFTEAGFISLKGYVSDSVTAASVVSMAVSESLLRENRLIFDFTFADKMSALLQKEGADSISGVSFYPESFYVSCEGDVQLEQLNTLSVLMQNISDSVGAEVLFVRDAERYENDQTALNDTSVRDSLVYFLGDNAEAKLNSISGTADKAPDIIFRDLGAQQDLTATESEGVTVSGNKFKESTDRALKKSNSTGKNTLPSPDDIAGVTLKPMRFVTMRSGEKVFEGAVFPGGFVLKSITLDSLIFEKGEAVYTVDLLRK